jgi:hypothetical protein
LVRVSMWSVMGVVQVARDLVFAHDSL